MVKPLRKPSSQNTTRAARKRAPGQGFKRAYLSLGSNLGHRSANLRRALVALAEAKVHIRRVSSLYETEPVDYLLQPWFINCVAEVETRFSPRQLLKVCHAIQRQFGRRPAIPKGPREIDIDILFYENVVVRSATLQIPHPRLDDRRFVLVPLCELEPELRHPVTQQAAAAMLAAARDRSRVVRLARRALAPSVGTNRRRDNTGWGAAGRSRTGGGRGSNPFPQGEK